MNSHIATWDGFRRPSSRTRLPHDFVLVLKDLMPLLDLVSLMVAAYASTALYAALQGHASGAAALWDGYGRNALAATILAPLLLHDSRTPHRADLDRPPAQLRWFIGHYLEFIGLVLALGFASRSLDAVPRGLMGLWFAAGFAMTLTNRLVLAAYLRRLERQGILSETVAVVGAGAVADRLIRHLLQTRPESVRIVGVFDDSIGAADAKCTFGPTGTIADLVAMGQQGAIDWVLITLPCTAERRVQNLVHTLKSLAITVGLCPQNVGLSVPCDAIGYVGDGLPVTLLADRPIKRWNAVAKAVEDLLLGMVITAILAPLMLLIAIAIRFDSPGPILFKQRRHASNNVEFDIYKFRTMRWCPEGENGLLQQTCRNDDRITRLGRFLRASSLDELPQLFNVLRGEMSLVGPRPHAVNMRTEQRLGHEIIDTYPHRHRVKPGITGWSQVHGLRGATETADELRRRVEFDLYYVEHWSLGLDLTILLMTAWVVLRGTNAR